MRLRPIPAVLLTCALLAAPADARAAFQIVLDAGPSFAANAAAVAAFNRAAARWGAVIDEDITVRIQADFDNTLPPGALAGANAALLAPGFDFVRQAMIDDAAGDPGRAIVQHLPTFDEFSAYINPGGPVTGLADAIILTSANAKALGAVFDDSLVDGGIVFGTGVNWLYDNSGGIAADQFDFESVVLHEIGHVLGFLSIVDDIDLAALLGFSGEAAPYALDLFRFADFDLPTTSEEFTNTPRAMFVGGNQSLSDLTNTYSMSTGQFFGDGAQASHWKSFLFTGSRIGLMDPVILEGQILDFSDADIRAFNLIGYNVVPEPSSVILMGVGLAVVGYAARRRRASAA